LPKLSRVAVVIALSIAIVSVGSAFRRTVIAQQSPEVRALWVQRGSLTSPASIISAVDMAKHAGFNTLIVQVRGRGDAFYNSRHEPRPAVLA
jgi:uncharacterized lipoprotein YddW (UPF0748 family)